MTTAEAFTARPTYLVIGRTKGGTVIDTLGMRSDRPFPSIGMAEACRNQKAAMTGPRVTWTVEEIPAVDA